MILPPRFAALSYAQHCHWMEQALAMARAAGQAGEIPVGAVLVRQGQILGQAGNQRQRDHDPTAHAEILALRQGGQILGRWQLSDCILYVTLEPCPMCAGAIVQARVGLLVYGASDPKAGAVRTLLNVPDSPACHHNLPVLAGILERRCQQQLQQWFQAHRQQNRQK